MARYCSIGQSPKRAVVLMKEEEEEEEEEEGEEEEGEEEVYLRFLVKMSVTRIYCNCPVPSCAINIMLTKRIDNN